MNQQINIEYADITDDDLESLEDEVGMGRGAWDMVDHRELLIACVKIAEQIRERKGSQ